MRDLGVISGTPHEQAVEQRCITLERRGTPAEYEARSLDPDPFPLRSYSLGAAGKRSPALTLFIF